MKVGLVEWSPETGIREEYYKPDSFALLPQTRSANEQSRRVEVTIRAAVAYKKNLFASLPLNVPEEIRRARYDVELIVLEIVKARALP